MEIQFTPIVTQKQASKLAKVAEKIYYDYYAGLIGEENIKYMLAEYQTANSVIEQIKTRKHNYYEIFCDGEFCGYFDIILFALTDRQSFSICSTTYLAMPFFLYSLLT